MTAHFNDCLDHFKRDEAFNVFPELGPVLSRS